MGSGERREWYQERDRERKRVESGMMRKKRMRPGKRRGWDQEREDKGIKGEKRVR